MSGKLLSKCIVTTVAMLLSIALSFTAKADETCMSPYIAKIQGQEDYVYGWTTRR